MAITMPRMTRKYPIAIAVWIEDFSLCHLSVDLVPLNASAIILAIVAIYAKYRCNYICSFIVKYST